jgi:outer membrane protein TolC
MGYQQETEQKPVSMNFQYRFDRRNRFRCWNLRLLMAAGLILTVWSGAIAVAAEKSGEGPFQETRMVYTLEESVKYGLSHNPGLQAARFSVDAAEAEIGSARGSLLPSLSSGYSHTRVSSIRSSGPMEIDYLDQNQDILNVQLSQTLFAGFTLYNSLQKARAARELAQAEQEVTELDLIINIQTGFLELLKARQDVLILEDAIARLEVVRKAVQAFYKQRLLPYSRVLEAEVDLADAKQQMSQARHAVQNQRIELNGLLDLPLTSEVEYKGNLDDLSFEWPKTLEKCLATAMERRPDLQAVQQNLIMAEKEAEIAKGRYYPKVSLKAAYNDSDRDYDDPGLYDTGKTYDRDQHNQYWTVGINMQWQMFDGGTQYYQKKKYEAEIMRFQQLFRETATNIKTRVRTSFLGMDEARQRIDLTLSAVKAAKENYRQEKRRFEVRVGTLPTLFDAQARLTRAESNYNQALMDYQISVASLYYAMGERNLDLKTVKP